MVACPSPILALWGRPLIVAGNGFFIREDEVIRRNLRTPSGAFKPSLIRFKPAAD
jgi:hypothetical protein